MKLICIEEHAVDPAIVKAAQPALNEEAPYFGLASSAGASGPTDSHRPTLLRMDEAIRLGADLGAGRAGCGQPVLADGSDACVGLPAGMAGCRLA